MGSYMNLTVTLSYYMNRVNYQNTLVYRIKASITKVTLIEKN